MQRRTADLGHEENVDDLPFGPTPPNSARQAPHTTWQSIVGRLARLTAQGINQIRAHGVFHASGHFGAFVQQEMIERDDAAHGGA